MIRKPCVAAMAGLTVISWMIADSQTSDAQLFRRLRERIQSRIPVPQTPINQPRFQPNAAQNNPQQPNQSDSNAGLTPRTVAPVSSDEPRLASPAKRAADPSVAANGTDRQSRTRQPNQPTRPGTRLPDNTLPATADAAAKDGSLFGNSILPNRKADTAGVNQGRASLGIQVVQSRQGIPGLEVNGINPGSHAPAAGLKVGDLIVSIEGQPTDSIANIKALLARRRSGENVRAQIIRDRKTSSIMIPLMDEITNRPTTEEIAKETDRQPAAPTTFGISYANVEGQRGALVTDIQKNSLASNSGLKRGDRIVSVNGRLLISAEALQQTLGSSDKETAIGLRMVRNGQLLSAKIDPNRTSAQAGSLAAGDKDTSAKENKSVLGGVGAIFGELLSGKSKQKSVDEMALGDDEGVRQVDFESDVQANVDSKKSTDPLSLEALEPPAGDDDQLVELVPPKQAVKKSIVQLQKKIEALQEQLRVIEEKE
jgi:membrane-associated protease RseP (regulator of RpoE activity)